MQATLRTAALLGLSALVLNALVAPFHGAAYFATEDGGEDLMPHQRAWGEALRGAVPAAFDAEDPQGAYVAWGRGTAVVIVLYAAALAALHSVQRRDLAGRARALGDATAAAWALLAVLALAEYLTPFTDEVFLALLPTLLATLVLSGFYGGATARAAAVPRAFGRTLLAAAVAFVPLVALAGHIPFGFLGFGAAWAVLAVRARAGAPGEPQR